MSALAEAGIVSPPLGAAKDARDILVRLEAAPFVERLDAALAGSSDVNSRSAELSTTAAVTSP